jgi:hypothetical protein
MNLAVSVLLCASFALAQNRSDNPERAFSQQGAKIFWRENHCEGYGPGDCSVRQPGTAQVRVEFSDRTVRLLVKCKTAKCVADPEEIAEWVKRAKESK